LGALVKTTLGLTSFGFGGAFFRAGFGAVFKAVFAVVFVAVFVVISAAAFVAAFVVGFEAGFGAVFVAAFVAVVFAVVVVIFLAAVSRTILSDFLRTGPLTVVFWAALELFAAEALLLLLLAFAAVAFAVVACSFEVVNLAIRSDLHGAGPLTLAF